MSGKTFVVTLTGVDATEAQIEEVMDAAMFVASEKLWSAVGDDTAWRVEVSENGIIRADMTYEFAPEPDEDGAPCCPDPECGGNPCTFPGYAAND